MKALTVMTVLGILLLAGPRPGHAAPFTFATFLDGASENPSNSSPGIGVAVAILDDTANTLRLVVAFGALEAPTTVAHIHCCVAPPGNVGIATPTVLPGFPLVVTAGVYDHTFDTTLPSTYSAPFLTDFGGGTAAGAEAALLAGLFAGQAYFNIHTSAHERGEIRGFFASVPEPGALELSLVGLGVIAVMIGATVRQRRNG
jgi:hypothetical protein